MKTKVYSSWNRTTIATEQNKITYKEQLWVQVGSNAICVAGSQIGEVVDEKLREEELLSSSPYSEERREADKGKEVIIIKRISNE